MATKNSKTAQFTESDRERLAGLTLKDRFGKSGFVMIPHSYFNTLLRKVSGLPEYFAIGYIMDRTFGCQRADGSYQEWFSLSLRQLARASVGSFTAAAFSIALEHAVRHGLIERRQEGNSFKYRAWPEAWILAPDYQPIAKDEDTVPEADEAEESEEAAAPASTIVEVQSGRSGKPIILSVSIKGVEAPVDLRFQPRNEAGIPLVFSASIAAGVVRFTVTRGDGCQASLTPMKAADLSNQRLSELRGALKQRFDHFWNKPLDEVFVQRVSRALGPDMPVAEFFGYADTEISAMRRKGKRIESGIFEFFAKKSRHAFEQAGGERTSLAAAARAQIARLRNAVEGLTEAQASEQIEKWRAAGWNADHAIANLERGTSASSGD